jgi:hypothetical protein
MFKIKTVRILETRTNHFFIRLPYSCSPLEVLFLRQSNNVSKNYEGNLLKLFECFGYLEYVGPLLGGASLPLQPRRLRAGPERESRAHPLGISDPPLRTAHPHRHHRHARLAGRFRCVHHLQQVSM